MYWKYQQLILTLNVSRNASKTKIVLVIPGMEVGKTPSYKTFAYCSVESIPMMHMTVQVILEMSQFGSTQPMQTKSYYVMISLL